MLEYEKAIQLLEAGRRFVGVLDLDDLLARVLDASRELTGARYAALGVVDEKGEGLQRFLTSGVDHEVRRQIGDLPSGHGVLGVLISDPQPLRLGDVGEHPLSYGFPPGHPPMEGFLGVPIHIGEAVYGNLYLTEKDSGAEFDDQDEETLVELARWAALAIENARRHGGLVGQRDELKRAVEAFEAGSTLAEAVAGETELDRVLELVVKRGRALVEARGMVLALRHGDELVVETISGESDRSLLGLRVPVEGSLGGHVLRTNEATRLADAPSYVRPVLPPGLDIKALLIVPLTFHGRSLGVLSAFDRLSGGPEFNAEDEHLMRSFAAAAATAVATAQEAGNKALERSLRAAERERTRWAHELHDQTLQDLAALQVSLTGVRRATDLDVIKDQLDRALDDVSLSITSLRALITDLRPAALDDLGTEPALLALASRIRTTGLDVAMEVDLDYERGRATTRHAPDFENTLYRLVQEALTNVVKHADASRVDVSIAEAAECVEIHIRDDGKGFDPDVAAEGFGLIGMQERVALIGGSLDVVSSPGRGTEISAHLPVVRAAEPSAS